MLGSLLSSLLAVWDWQPARRWHGHLAFLIPAAGILGALIYVGAVPTHACGHDAFQLLDGAWRILNGQRPHVDFYSPLGPVTYLAGAAGMAIGGLRVEGIGYAAALAALLVGVWAYGLLVSRMRFTPAVVTSLFLMLLTATPVPLGAGPPSLSHAMAYNRLGYALAALVLIETLEAPPGARRRSRREFLAGLSSGALCILLLFEKASYFAVAIAFVAAFALVRPRGRWGWAGVLAGAAVAFAAAAVYLKLDVAAFVSDQAMAGQVRRQLLHLLPLVATAWRYQGQFVLVLFLAILITIWRAPQKEPLGLRGWKWIAAAITVFGADILLLSTNAQDAGLPLSTILVVLMAGSSQELRLTGAPADPAQLRGVRASCAAGAVLALGVLACPDTVSLLQAIREKWRGPAGRQVVLFDSAPLRGWVLYDLPDANHPLAYSNGSKYVGCVNDGIRLLRRESTPDATVTTLEQVNPFPYALQRKPARGGATFMASGYTFSDVAKPPAERLFGNADVVMVPKRSFTDAGQHGALVRNYLPYVQQAYSLAAQSSCWWMYRRRQ